MSKEIKTGGTAFPVRQVDGVHQTHWGMDLRDYFIAHAPHTPQEWFEPIMPERPVESEEVKLIESNLHFYSEQMSHEERRHLARKKHELECAYREAVYKWNAMREKQRFVQWPVAWADAMIEAKGEE